jgi:hypothetical protein
MPRHELAAAPLVILAGDPAPREPCAQLPQLGLRRVRAAATEADADGHDRMTTVTTLVTPIGLRRVLGAD